MPADLAVRNVRIVDGTGAPAVEGDVEVTDGRITAVGTAGPARVDLDGAGMVCTPGFVDTHTHDDGALVVDPGMGFKLAQGCTSVVIGNCGFSAVPNERGAGGRGSMGGLLGSIDARWDDLDGYFGAVAGGGPAVNAISLVGHNTLRAAAMGGEQAEVARREVTDAELARMKGWVERAMEQGACGLSTGLIYRPGRWSTTEEVVALAEVVAPFGGLYATHMRNEREGLLDAVEETIRIGREAGIPVHISHHKAAGRPNWGLVRDSLALVDRRNAEGADITLDVYPYTAGSGRMVEYFDLERISVEFAEVVRLASCPPFRELEGRMLKDVAAEQGRPIEDLVREILTAPGGERTICIHFIIDEADIEANLRHPLMMVGSDGIPGQGMPHPRLYGTFPRVLAEYVRERGVLGFEEAVRRMTSLSCDRFGLVDRGRVAEGQWADLVVLDPAAVVDRATYDEPTREPEGIAWVLVNGQVAYDHGRHTGVGAGRTLRYRREDAQ